MDWRSVTFDWNHARAFLVTAEEGSLSAAARALGTTQPTLGRQVSALEEALGVTLFERVGRGLALTTSGNHLLAHVRQMGEAATAAALAASGQQQTIEGHVAITASEIYAYWLLPPVLDRVRREAPGVTVDIVASNRVRDLKRREADIALRNARPDQSDLIGRQVATDSATFFGTRACLDRYGPIRVASDLTRAEIIGIDSPDGMIQALAPRGVALSAANFPLVSDSHVAHWAMGRAGLGLCIGPCALGDADPVLHRAVPDFVIDYPVWLVAHRELRTSPRIRLVWDILADMIPKLLHAT